MSLQFNRPDLARDMAEAVLGRVRFGYRSGLFLANRRRTGKTTFLKIDLIPALRNLGAVTVYVDLWVDKDTPPGVLIAGAISEVIAEQRGLLSKLELGRLRKVAVYGVEVEVAGPVAAREATLHDLLRELHRLTGRQIVLLVDEAQHAVTTEHGMNVMSAIKSARDQMNTPGELNLSLVMTGSDRDKLCRLVSTNKAPFLGASIDELPVLGRDYIEFLARSVEEDRPDIHVDVDRMYEAFIRLEHRPELMEKALKTLTGVGRPPADQFHPVLDQLVEQEVRRSQARYLDVYQSMSDPQRAVLERFLSTEGNGGPFEASAKAQYEQFLGRKLANGQIQNAIEGLRNRDPAILWKSERAEYALDDQGLRRWYEQLRDAGQWPPREQ